MKAVGHDSHLGGASVPGLHSTAVPFREQFRCRRWWFFYHDIRAFTTSWLPLPIFATYRVILAIYVLVWLILHILARREEFGPLWLIFLTNLSYALLSITTTSLAMLCVVYTIIHYWNKDRLLKFIPKMDFPVVRVYKKQDNIPWYVKLIWLLYISACSAAFLVFIGYWGFLYSPCDESGSGDGDNDNNTTMGTDDDGSGGSGEESCSTLDVHTIQVHGINIVIVFLDMILSRIPYQFFHFVHSAIFTMLYVIFSLVYWGAGGENHEGDPFIYSTLDYGERPVSGVFAVLAILSPMLTFIILFLLASLRDMVSVHIGCCFRDIKKLPYRDNSGSSGMSDEDLEDITKV